MVHDSSTGKIRTKKAMLRKEKLAMRRELSELESINLSKKICLNFLDSEEYKKASTILLYKAYNNEVDTEMIFEQALNDGKTVAYPVSEIGDGEPDLCFYPITKRDQFREGFKGILEPDTDKITDVFKGPADICITPGVVFDRKCHRIGYGKAFYDRYIRLNRPRTVIGLAYDIQITDDFEPEGSDREVDMVITESGAFRK